jgi:FkbM family methyltransferase
LSDSQQIERLRVLKSSIGTRAAIEYAVQQRAFRLLEKCGISVKGRLISLHVTGHRFPIRARYGSSDLDVFEQIFVQEEHRPLRDVREARLIVDCGAYVGYSGMYLLDAFPDAHLIAVEPDEGNFALLDRNLGCYGERVSLIHSAIWPSKTRLVVSRGEYRDGREWANQVRESLAGEEPSVDAIDIETLLADYPSRSIDILKIDIEGAEAILFASNCESWLDRVRNIAIELHGPECETAFFERMSRYEYELSRSGELTICRNIVRRSA